MKDFYLRHIKNIRDFKLICEECGCNLSGDFSEVAHILHKSKFKSIALDDDNIIYLCGYSGNNCHAKFDLSSTEEFRKMKVFNKVSQRYEELKSKIKEKINYKIEERYGES